jgi:hypothetical protein
MRLLAIFLLSIFILRVEVLADSSSNRLQPVDFGLSGLRFAMVGGSVAAGGLFEFDASNMQALVVGSTAGGLSATLMLLHPQLVTWLSSKGLIKFDREKNAGFIEMHFKEFLVSFAFNYSVQIASGLVGLSDHGLSPLPPAIIALIALPTQGVWELSISRTTQELLQIFPARSPSIWMMSKFAIITNSAISTFASVSTMLGAEWTTYLLAGIGISGFASFGLSCTSYGKCLVKKLYSGCQTRLRGLKKSLEPKIKDE